MIKFNSLNDQHFLQLKHDIEQHPRMCGYYTIGMVAIPGFPTDQDKRETLLDALFQHFDDQTWLPPAERPSTKETWDEYETSRDEASQHMVEALVGGSAIGHTVRTIEPKTALDLWERFDMLFASPRHYYAGMGLGDPEYVFQYGIVIVDSAKAGILWIVESD